MNGITPRTVAVALQMFQHTGTVGKIDFIGMVVKRRQSSSRDRNI
jgi:hypothetical protein